MPRQPRDRLQRNFSGRKIRMRQIVIDRIATQMRGAHHIEAGDERTNARAIAPAGLTCPLLMTGVVAGAAHAPGFFPPGIEEPAALPPAMPGLWRAAVGG